ncbi:hypothetical protein LJC07_04785 [Christensenellaceae bacterium OttesenSCG-928-L17]|nr:hypothetical protein [Christensenellaceae bacterium OttesenSCG-928-L17]
MTNASTALAAYRDISKTGSSYTFQLTAAERNAMRAATPNSNTLKVRFYLKSIIGGVTSIPYLERNLTIVNGKPTFTSFSYLDTNASTTAITGNNQLLIQGKSTLQATIPSANKATPNKSATMSQYLFSIASFNGSQPYSSSSNVVQNIGAISQSGTQRLNVTALDSRSNTTVAYKDITVIPYTQPLINASATRAGGGFETQTTIHIEGVMSLIQVSGSTKNAVNATNGVKYRYKQSSSSSWGTWTPLTSTTNASGKITTADILINFDNNSQWDIEVSITDKLSTTVQPITLSSGIPILFVDRQKKVGVNKRPQNGDLDVAGKIYSGGQPLMPSHVGQVIFSTTLNTAAKVAAIYGGSWVAFATGRTIVGVDTAQTEFNTVKKTGGSKTITLNTTQIPSHRHNAVNWISSGGFFVGNGSYTTLNVSVPTTATGGGQAHDNMSPYVTCYAWERVS